MILDDLKAMKEELAALAKEGEDGTEVTENDAERDEVPEDDDAGSTPEPQPAPEPAPTPKEEDVPEKPDNEAFRKMRRELAAANKRADEAEARAREHTKKEAEELEQVTTDPELEEIREERKYIKAERAFEQYENDFKKREPGYSDVAAEYSGALARAVKLQNPRMPDSQVIEETKKLILKKAAVFLNDGFDPIEELYHEAKGLGFTGESMRKKEVIKEEKEIKPDLKKVASNRARSAGMAATGGHTERQMTVASAAELSPLEWSKLSKNEKARLLAGG